MKLMLPPFWTEDIIVFVDNVAKVDANAEFDEFMSGNTVLNLY